MNSADAHTVSERADEVADQWWMVVGWAGSALAVISLMQTRIVRLRTLNLVACLIVMVYHVPLAIWPTVVLNAIVAAINAVYLVRLQHERLGGGGAQNAEEPRPVETRSSNEIVRAILELNRVEVEARSGMSVEQLVADDLPVSYLHNGRTILWCRILMGDEDQEILGDGDSKRATPRSGS